MSKGGGKFGGNFGDDAVSAMKNWASRLEAERARPGCGTDWGFLATGDINDRQGENISGRLAAVQKELDVLEAKAKQEGWKQTSSSAYDTGVSPEAHIAGVWTKRRSPNDPSIKPTNLYLGHR